MADSAPPAGGARRRAPWIPLVLVGLLITILASTAALFASAVPPCVPANDGAPTPPVADCGVAVVPYLGVAVAGVVMAAVAFRKSG